MEFAASGLPVVIVNPTTPVGAGDLRPTPTGKIILDFIRGRMPAYVDTGLNIVGVEDVARGHLLAEVKGEIGQRYILGGENWSLEEILDALAHISGRRTPRVRIPWLLAWFAGSMDNLVLGTILRREPIIPLEGVKMARHRMYVSSEKARRELGYDPGPVEKALRDAVLYFRFQWRPDSANDRITNLREHTI
jgi:dihydroflavonol-4-reductase